MARSKSRNIVYMYPTTEDKELVTFQGKVGLLASASCELLVQVAE